LCNFQTETKRYTNQVKNKNFQCLMPEQMNEQ